MAATSASPPTPQPAAGELLDRSELRELADRYAARLATGAFDDKTRSVAEPGQSMVDGAAGIALAHVERALAGHGDWTTAHTWITRAAAGTLSAADTSGLFLGAPAIAFVLHCTGRYRNGLAELDRHLSVLAHRRVDQAMARIARGAHARFREYDLFFGLTGIGALLLRRQPGGTATERVLTYLVALTRARRVENETLPGWWVDHDPHRRNSPAYPGGHANLGLAHGIAGPLALLSHAHRRGVTVDAQLDAIAHVADWLDTWRQDADTGPWWPQWITRSDQRTRRSRQPHPGRPSWCYGTPGIARAEQLAALALDDHRRRHCYEQALMLCLDDPVQRARITGPGLCHGSGGLYQTVWRAARDATTPDLARRLPGLARTLAEHAREHVDTGCPDGSGLLDGDTGTALALHTAVHDQAPSSGWDACLLLA